MNTTFIGDILSKKWSRIDKSHAPFVHTLPTWNLEPETRQISNYLTA